MTLLGKNKSQTTELQKIFAKHVSDKGFGKNLKIMLKKPNQKGKRKKKGT